jgi:hypothetical protein
MHAGVAAAAEQHEVGEVCWATIGPVHDVMRVGPTRRCIAPDAALVASGQGPPLGARDGPCATSDVEDLARAIGDHAVEMSIAGKLPDGFT